MRSSARSPRGRRGGQSRGERRGRGRRPGRGRSRASRRSRGAPRRAAAAVVHGARRREAAAETRRLHRDGVGGAERRAISRSAEARHRLIEDDRGVELGGELGVAEQVLRGERLLDGGEAQAVDAPQPIAVRSRRRAVGAVGIGGEHEVREGRAHRGEASRRSAPRGDLALHPPVAGLHRLGDLGEHGVGAAEADVRPRRHCCAGRAEERERGSDRRASARRRGGPSRGRPWPSDGRAPRREAPSPPRCSASLRRRASRRGRAGSRAPPQRHPRTPRCRSGSRSASHSP